MTTSVARLTLHVANKTSYEILLSSLPVGARSIIKLDRNQYINLLSVEKAYNKYQTKNLDILRCIVTDIESLILMQLRIHILIKILMEKLKR